MVVRVRVVGGITVAVLMIGCSAQTAYQPTPTPRIVYMTPQQTVPLEPSQESTPDVRPAWFDSACEAAERLNRAYDDWVQAIDRSDQGDKGDVLDWVNNGRSALQDGTAALDHLPVWETGAPFVTAANALGRALSEDFERIDDGPLRQVTSSTFNRITGLRSDLYFAGDAASAASGGRGCGLDQVVS